MRGVLSLAKLGAHGAAYYLDTVATGAEEYYLGVGEAEGAWMGSASSTLGLAGRVDADDLRTVLAGVAPTSGLRLAASNRKVPGFDLTFSAPKSASLLWAFGGKEASMAVVRAHEAAVAGALGYLERQSCFVRRGHNGVEQVAGSGFVAAGFRHRTSRAGDPQLHTHVVVANLAQASDGVWRTLDARHLYRHHRTAGFLYRAQLRAELTRRLGVEWLPARNGMAEMAGVPEDTLRVFSQRRQQIVEHLTRRGERGAKASEIAALETRHAKTSPSIAGLGADWEHRAGRSGMGPSRWQDLLKVGRKRRKALTRALTVPLISPGQLGVILTDKDSTFSRRDVLRALAERAQPGADIKTIERQADVFLTSPEAVGLAEDSYSTPSHLAIEREVLSGAAARQSEHTAVVPDAVIERAIAGSRHLSDEQQTMVRQLTSSGAGVEVVIGLPGSGKTTALAAANTAWRDSDHHVVGAALAARAAQELEQATAIRSFTLAALLGSLERETLQPRSVVIVDEAGMVGTRTLHAVLAHAQKAGAKVVLVGDPKQLPEIGAGGAFRALTRTLQPIRLTANHRQRDPAERRALTHLRAGRIDKAMGIMNAHGRVTHSPGLDAATRQMIHDWQAARVSGEQVLLLAARRSQVEHLNTLAQAARLNAGELQPEHITIGRLTLHVGDTVMTLRNDRRYGTINGQRGEVTSISGDSVTIQTDSMVIVALTVRLIERGYLQLGYAVTIHKSQGATSDRSLVLATDDLGFEAGYTALTRGRNENHLYLTQAETPSERQRHLRRNTAKALAHEVTDGRTIG